MTLLSNQHFSTNSTFPNISILAAISREQHAFTWDTTIELPIAYSELPLDSVIAFSFFARLFQVGRKLIGTTNVRLFSQKTRHLRTGPFTLTFDHMPETTVQKHIRGLSTGKRQPYEFVDDQLRCVSKSLHPTDTDRFFNSLLHPLEKPALSQTSQFVRLTILNPSGDPCTAIAHSDFLLPSPSATTSVNPYQRLYCQLARAQGASRSALLQDSNITETLNKVKTIPPLSDLPSAMKTALCNHVGHCLSDPALLPALFRSVNWAAEEEARAIASQLLQCKPVDVEYALEFFTKRYDQPPVREFAVRCIGSVDRSELSLYIPQLLQSAKAKYAGGLAPILVAHAKEDAVFASHLYWAASLEKDEPAIRDLLVMLAGEIPDDLREDLEQQENLVRMIKDMLETAHQGKPSPEQIRERVRDLLTRPDSACRKLQHFDQKVRFPLDPVLFAVGIDPSDVKVFQSKLRPVMLTFIMENDVRYRVMFKIGDDMQQDQLIIQLFEVMDHIFQRASLRLPITAYRTLAFSSVFGCCEFIDNSRAIRDINTRGQRIRDFLEEDHDTPIDSKIERFTASLAAYCVMTYVLKIGDRHDNNILVTRDGRLLHIDYGYILGDVTKPFTPPLKLSQEMVDTVGADGLQRICGWAGPAFNSLRKRARLILVLIELMFTAPLTCFQQNPMRRLQQVENSLLLNCTEIEAMNSLQATFSESLNSKMQVIWEHIHDMAMATSGPSAEG
jgi:phosphatidylinositol 3-kinase